MEFTELMRVNDIMESHTKSLTVMSQKEQDRFRNVRDVLTMVGCLKALS